MLEGKEPRLANQAGLRDKLRHADPCGAQGVTGRRPSTTACACSGSTRKRPGNGPSGSSRGSTRTAAPRSCCAASRHHPPGPGGRRTLEPTSTLKLRGPEGCLDPKLWGRRIGAFGGDAEDDAKIEGDWAADRRLVAASLDSDVEAALDELVAGRPDQVRRLMSDAQAALAGELLLGLDELGRPRPDPFLEVEARRGS